jgi:hypothetical protein
MSNDALTEQTKRAFDFTQKLYDEVALLIREVEAVVRNESERFVLGMPGGYGIVSRGSSQLEPANVKMWPLRRFGCFFVPESETELKGGLTETKLSSRPLYLRVVLDGYAALSHEGAPLQGPTVLYATFSEIASKGKFRKFEQFVSHFEYNENRVFAKLPRIEYEDAYVRVTGECHCVPLFDLRDANAATDKLIRPALALYRRPAISMAAE